MTTTEQTDVYRAGRLARQRGCYRLLFNPASDQERDEWLRGWDDEDSDIRRAERIVAREKSRE